MADIKELTVENFKADVLEFDGVSIVDFWAPWCGYCVRMMPIFEELAGELGDKVNFAKVNTDEVAALAQQFNVEVLPTFAIVKNGEVVDRKIGFVPKEELKAAIEAHV
ncbi:thioredoxin [uncultured Veillonella sp.]|uniref:thioredoxin n=1 Tax=uncultured Veillonella sp. TaxID=159268 RepID=UPI0025D96ED6|nr:thioredoxin [uncultured Veillonella sp.]MDY3974079.1 thioredoxin [Veillonella caviae]